MVNNKPIYIGDHRPNFDGEIGEYIRLLRTHKKINSTTLAKLVGKSNAYVSHLEKGRYNKPDYETLYKILKILGIKEELIESYLYHFHIYSPDYLADEEARAIAAMGPPTEEDIKHMEEQDEYYYELEKEEVRLQQDAFEQRMLEESNDGNPLLEDMLDENIKSINKVLTDMIEYDLENSFDLIVGFSKTLDDVSTNKPLYNFIIKFFSEKVTSLDNEGLTKVINTLYDELNRVDREKTAFGKPRQRKLLDKI
ncbi:helix-turn-helix domain-containing protein [Peribacillus frigoritolerans]|uniref:helix-turn-helix domain-containing protein n=1 Tax=Peribacillus frigoritolerans TaxID=450367 RepID=UPI0022277C89|nr:helix-turn-helix transcriptional regulator [Peribacillus frigoritolerans]UYZ01185.1 helix-turn-helix domain-containing protein [Peribacillus frigoritolerans]